MKQTHGLNDEGKENGALCRLKVLLSVTRTWRQCFRGRSVEENEWRGACDALRLLLTGRKVTAARPVLRGSVPRAPRAPLAWLRLPVAWRPKKPS